MSSSQDLYQQFVELSRQTVTETLSINSFTGKVCLPT